MKKPVGTGDELFRVKVVGSNPAGPTKSLFRVNKRFYGFVFKNSLKRSDLSAALANEDNVLENLSSPSEKERLLNITI